MSDGNVRARLGSSFRSRNKKVPGERGAGEGKPSSFGELVAW